MPVSHARPPCQCSRDVLTSGPLPMHLLRAWLPRLVAGWLACQLVAFAAAPVALGGDGLVAASTDCDCPSGATDQLCPMHQSPNRRLSRQGDCTVQNTRSPSDAVLLSLGIGLGVLPPPTLHDVACGAESVVVPSMVSVSRSELPDSPPPRT